MKTEIRYKHVLTGEYLVDTVLPLPNSKCVVMTWNYGHSMKIDVISFEGNESIVSELAVLPYQSSKYHLFRTTNAFGLMIGTDEVRLWNDFISAPEIFKIKNDFRADKFGRKNSIRISTFDENTNRLYFGLETRESQGFPARYWAGLKIEDKTLLGINLGKQARWSSERQLDLNSFPKTAFAFSTDEFLSINHMMVKPDTLYVHTVGGTTTRLKSGKAYEFSIISKMSLNGEVIQNYDIGEGLGYFSTSKEYFILHNRKNKKCLTFYRIDDLSVAFEISLTPTQNVGDAKFNFLVADTLDGNLYIYNTSFFHICRLVE